MTQNKKTEVKDFKDCDVSTKTYMSKNGKYVVTETTVKTWKHINYVKKVIGGDEQ